MADFTLKVGDTKPSITGNLTDGDGEAVDLNGASVVFVMRLIDATDPTVEYPADIIDADNGIVRYDWVEGDTDVAGGYYAEWDVTFADTSRGTFPNDGMVRVAIYADLEAVGS